jgi:hypothetical protein
MDSYLNIISLALAIAALVPVLLPTVRVRLWTITSVALSLIVLVGTYQAYNEYSERQSVRAVKEEIWGLLTKTEKGMTFEQIYDSLYYRSFPIANTALDALVEEGRVQNEKKEAVGQDGTKYVVRRYFRAFGD